jgi:hypothetical protein
MSESQEEGQVKVAVTLERDEDGYPPFDSEDLWSTPVGEGRYRIESIPLFARGIAWGDIVTAVSEEEEELLFQEVVEPSGHSTVRLMVAKEEEVPAILEHFERQGCTGENHFTPRLIALDVPPSISLDELKQELDMGYALARWDYEEACIAQTESPL